MTNTTVTNKSDYSLNETAQLIRVALKEAFPATTFSLELESYPTGCSILVGWTDGPTSMQVRPILSAFEGCDFDEVTDVKTERGPAEWRGQQVKFHVDFVQDERSYSADALRQASQKVVRVCGLPELLVIDGKYGPDLAGGGALVQWRLFPDGRLCPSYDGETHSLLVHQVSWITSQSQQERGRR